MPRRKIKYGRNILRMLSSKRENDKNILYVLFAPSIDGRILTIGLSSSFFFPNCKSLSYMSVLEITILQNYENEN
jgi:hypothetical protein